MSEHKRHGRTIALVTLTVALVVFWFFFDRELNAIREESQRVIHSEPVIGHVP